MISLIESSVWFKYLTEITDVTGLHLWTKIYKYKTVQETLMIFYVILYLTSFFALLIAQLLPEVADGWGLQ